MKHLACFHLFNDYSGSPKILKNVLEGLAEKGYGVDLVTSNGGVLDELSGLSNIRIHHYNYKFSENRLITLLRYTKVQIYTFFYAFRWIFSKDSVFYINTLLPVGPAIAGRLMGKKVIYHYHENAFKKGLFYKSLAWIMQRIASKIICVSAYQASFLKSQEKTAIVSNALSNDFTRKLTPNIDNAFERKTVLMLSSLKGYKGTKQFIMLSKKLPQFNFVLVINDTQLNIDNYLIKEGLVKDSNNENLKILPRQEDVTPFYNRSSIVLNLSDKNKFVETFGLTALEAMADGLPVIVPTVGGIADLVGDGVNGYKTDVTDMKKIELQILNMLSDKSLYQELAINALKCASQFSEDKAIGKIIKIIG